MTYKVILSPEAEHQLLQAAAWYRRRDSGVALEWYNGFLDAIFKIGIHPRQYSISRENDRFAVELRELLYGSGRRKTHRAVFRIVVDRVEVVAIRHLAQRDLDPTDIG